ncbi:MAG: HNH endonuclease [Ardenticatenaceae bacterium]|nr:HNH endonuclease [Ardenticatenaceae bacterium]
MGIRSAAAHIIPWSESHNDDPRNGLALCHLCH